MSVKLKFQQIIRNTCNKYIICGFVLFCVSNSVFANNTWVALSWGNDFIAHEDSGYTNGSALSWGYGPLNYVKSGNEGKYNFLKWFYVGADLSEAKYAISYQISQAMFTPEDLREVGLVEKDRPYAGLLTWNTSLHVYDRTISSRYQLTLGLVGPASGVKYVQKYTHKAIGKKTPNGWRNQLGNEPGVNVSASRQWRLKSGKFTELLRYDWLGAGAGELGTLGTQIGMGGGFRIGHALHRSFSAAAVVPERYTNPLVASLKNEWHLFANLYGRYVFKDILLDGNTFDSSHSVTLIHEQFLYSIGASYHTEVWGAIVSVQDSSRLFEEKNENHFFSNISFTFHWN